MPYKRRSNPNNFTTDEAQSATLAYTEGTPVCQRSGKYRYPEIRVSLCVKEGLEPISRLTGRTIYRETAKTVKCLPEDFPPDGRGRWRIAIPARTYLRIKPLIPKRYQEKWNKKWTEQGCPPRPTRAYRRKRKTL